MKDSSETLDETLRTAPRGNKIMLLSDFNAREGKHCDIWDGIINYQHSVTNKLLDIELHK